MKNKGTNPPLFSVIGIFLDTNVYISGLISSEGASNAILYAAEAGAFQVHITPFVILEAKEVLADRFKTPSAFDKFQELIDSMRPITVKVTENEVQSVYEHCNDLSDAPLLAVALKSKARYYITLDKKAFKIKRFRKPRHLTIVTPGEFMKILRRVIGDRGY